MNKPTVLKYNKKIVQRGKIETQNTHLCAHLLTWVGTFTSIDNWDVERATLPQTSRIEPHGNDRTNYNW